MRKASYNSPDSPRGQSQELLAELQTQDIEDWRLWEGIIDANCRIKGILAAHQQIIRWASENGEPYVMIAEDDVKFTDRGTVFYYLRNEPSEYDLYLGGIICGKLNSDNSLDDFSGTHS